jgi:hypothetical protein
MIYIVDEDIVLRHVNFQLDRKVEAKVMLNPDGFGIDLLCDDGDLSFTITFTPAYIDLLHDLLVKLKHFNNNHVDGQ